MRPFPSLTPPIFVVQKHQARTLHYDFRLEIEGTLVSWAIPKGPSLSPKDKRLAVRVADHSLSYGDFEGRIREGEYGAGAVIVWDYGIWVPAAPSEEGLAVGQLDFLLQGKKLKGKWRLLRFRHGKPKDWLLIKKDDSESVEGDITVESPRSAVSGKTLAEIATDPEVRELSCKDFG